MYNPCPEAAHQWTVDYGKHRHKIEFTQKSHNSDIAKNYMIFKRQSDGTEIKQTLVLPLIDEKCLAKSWWHHLVYLFQPKNLHFSHKVKITNT
jgi:hypothetical protein